MTANRGSAEPLTMQQQQYKPSQEVTLRSNAASDVAVFGKGYADEAEMWPDALVSEAYVDRRGASKGQSWTREVYLSFKRKN